VLLPNKSSLLLLTFFDLSPFPPSQSSLINCKTPQLERNWGGGEKEREREREKLRSREILSFLERKCPVENVLNFYMWRESL
jgi:hypothetical protein